MPKQKQHWHVNSNTNFLRFFSEKVKDNVALNPVLLYSMMMPTYTEVVDRYS